MSVCFQLVPCESNHIDRFSLVDDIKFVISPLLFAGLYGKSIFLSFNLRSATSRSSDSQQEDYTTTPHLHTGMPYDLRWSCLPDCFQTLPFDFLWPIKYERKENMHFQAADSALSLFPLPQNSDIPQKPIFFSSE